MGNKLIASLQISFQAVQSEVANGAMAHEILYTWVEDGRECFALTRNHGSPPMPAQERQNFLSRNLYKEWD